MTYDDEDQTTVILDDGEPSPEEAGMVEDVQAALDARIPEEGQNKTAGWSSPESEEEEQKAGHQPEEKTPEEEPPYTVEELNGMVGELADQVEHYRQLEAQAWQPLQQWVSESGLDASGFQEGLEATRIFNDALSGRIPPGQALGALLPYIAKLQEMDGYGPLPGELQQAIDQGEISEAFARQLHQARTHGQQQQHWRQQDLNAIQQQQQAYQQQQQEHQQQQWQEATYSHVSEWGNHKRATDPDYGKILPFLEQAFQLAATNGTFPPANPAQVGPALDALYEQVRQQLAPFAHRPQRKKPIFGNTAGMAPDTDDMFEAANLAANAV